MSRADLRRHVLVIATHCNSKPRIPELQTAAEGLAEVLGDDGYGACEPGLPDGTASIVGSLSAGVIRDRIQQAVDYARQERATLVLALLGHGFVLDADTTLYLMAAESGEDIPNGAINVPELLTGALITIGPPGLIGIVDTCHAGGAVPDGNGLAIGVAQGRTSLGLLLAATAHKEAYNFRMSRELATVVREGLPKAEEWLDVRALGVALSKRIDDQGIGILDYSGNPDRIPPVAYNRAFAPEVVSSPSIAAHDLAEALRELADIPGAAGFLRRVEEVRDNPAARRELRKWLDDLDHRRRKRTDQVLDGIFIAQQTTDLLRRHLAAVLQPALLRSAILDPAVTPRCYLTEVREKLTGRSDADYPDYVEYLALRRHRLNLVHFVCLLAVHAEPPVDDRHLREWARLLKHEAPLNEIRGQLRAAGRDRKAQLIVTLDPRMDGEWRGTARTWLRRDGADVERGRFGTESANQQQDAEAILGEAVQWAEQIIMRENVGNLRLCQVDIALPARLMLSWRPEELEDGPPLGRVYNVFMHWSTRIDPPAHLRWLYRDAKHRWEHVDHPQAPARVGWLDRDHTRDLRELDRYLGRRLFPTGLALAHHPATEIELLETLLKHSPVVFWPWSTTGFPDAARGDLKNIWDELPHALMAAYRDRWNGPDVEPVADLRAVWEDPDWLEFIRKLNPQLNSSTG